MILSQQTLFAEPTIAEQIIIRGTGFAGGKERVIELYKKELTRDERAAKIRREYGIMGGGSRGDYMWRHDAKGIRVWNNEKIVANLSWHEVDEIIGRLIAEDRYL